MTLEEIRAYCLSLPAVEESIKWEAHLCFCIGEKMFFLGNPDAFPISASFKCSKSDFDELIDRAGFRPAPYLARYHWVHIDNIESLSPKEWKRLLGNAYQLVYDKLPKNVKQSLAKQ
jgi:predicted DNA-binding protein (MmcQ/YjbR family)